MRLNCRRSATASVEGRVGGGGGSAAASREQHHEVVVDIFVGVVFVLVRDHTPRATSTVAMVKSGATAGRQAHRGGRLRDIVSNALARARARNATSSVKLGELEGVRSVARVCLGLAVLRR
jgi:hypothetical protein